MAAEEHSDIVARIGRADLGSTSTGALAAHLASLPEWRVLGICRSQPTRPIANVEYVLTDLMDPAAAKAALTPFADTTHAFFCGRAPHDDRGREERTDNYLIALDNMEAIS